MFNENHYIEYSQQISYMIDTGVAQMGVAAPAGTPCSIVQTHSPTMKKIVSWRARKLGSMPDLPHPDPQSPNEVFAGGYIKPAVPSRTAEGNVVVQVEGQYIYLLLKPVWVEDPMPMGTTPVDSSPASNYAIGPQHFKKGLLGGASQQPKGPDNDSLGTFIRA